MQLLYAFSAKPPKQKFSFTEGLVKQKFFGMFVPLGEVIMCCGICQNSLVSLTALKGDRRHLPSTTVTRHLWINYQMVIDPQKGMITDDSITRQMLCMLWQLKLAPWSWWGSRRELFSWLVPPWGVSSRRAAAAASHHRGSRGVHVVRLM